MFRKKLRKPILMLMTVAMLASVLPYGVADAAKKATLKTKKITVNVGKTKKIVIKNKKKKKTYTFKVNKKKIATVSKKGVVKGKKAGTAKVTVSEVTKKGKKKKAKVIGKVTVKVTKKKNDIPVNTVTPATQAPVVNPTAVPQPTDPANYIYVSALGNDAGTGTKASPFKTIEKARQHVRTMDKTKGDIIVWIADGLYEVDSTINFTSADSGNENCTIYYKAEEGANPIISGGKKLTSAWEVADDVDWLENGLVAYKTPLNRDEKLRALYVNGQRAEMTTRSTTPSGSYGNYKITKGEADWAWNTRSNMITNVQFANSFGLDANTRNPQNIELESGSRWAQQLVCVEDIAGTADGKVDLSLQMPYAAFAQNLGWGTAYNPSTVNDVTNVFEWLANPGEFYFDQEGSMLYYIPRDGEDINTAEVVVPQIDTIVEFRGDEALKSYVQNITFDGLHFAYTDWNLYEVEGSHGYASVQGSIVLANFGLENQHNDIYRSYDVPPAAIYANSTKNVKIINGEVRYTGYLGIHLENDVIDCDVTGNYIGQTGGAGIVVGHPTHVYENDTEIHHVKEIQTGGQHVKVDNAAGPDKEKFPYGTEKVPTNITITNNYLHENCYFFPGNSPLTTFYTYNMQVLHNFVYKCSYSGMSIGWGWCNFDGYDGEDSQLPGVPTTTSKNNHVNYNRVEEICSLLQDAGGIYTLGQQGNDDWTEYSEMSFNYINAKREPQVANGSRMVNGFHPDEGSAYIKFDSNVVTNIIRNVYELNDWRRKHDMIVTNGFSNTDRSETTAPNCTLEQYVNADYIWPEKGYETVLYSGLEDDYVYMVGDDVIPDTDYELAANVRLGVGQQLKRRGLLKATDTVWLAPEGTTSFAESDVMTKAAGNEKTMPIPQTPGEYKLYIVYEDGSVSDTSTFTLYVGESSDVANVSEGQNYNVSNINPLELELKVGYTYRLNNNNITNGHKISEAGIWTLEAISKEDSKVTTVLFTTSVSDANKLLINNVKTTSGGTVTFDNVLSDASMTIWLAQSGLSAFDKNDPAQSWAPGNSATMKAPQTPGKYILTIVDAEGDIYSQSDAFVTVE